LNNINGGDATKENTTLIRMPFLIKRRKKEERALPGINIDKSKS
jgi:hypothetical protein